MPPPSVHITGLAAASALGGDLNAHLDAMAAGRSGLLPLARFPDRIDPAFQDLLAGWIADRDFWFRGRRYGAASNAAVRAARQALTEAGWSASQRADAWLFGGSSRANVGELLGAWKTRRPIAKFKASNSMHSEVTAAVSIELGLHGPWQMLANGCSASLDAIGLAWMALRSGAITRALVVGVELPLCDPLLQGFADTGLLAISNTVNDPYHPGTNGFFPGESVVAITLEAGHGLPGPEILGYSANSDAYDSIALPPDGAALARLLAAARANATQQDLRVTAICPHANGTESNRDSETAALHTAFAATPLTLHLTKPFTGHSLGASGALDVALLAAAMRQGHLPPNLPAVTAPQPQWNLPAQPLPLAPDAVVLKIALGMGGHNAVLLLRPGKAA
jgi:3-oxoacyl-[acyl-carrier-protein] synthase II